MQKVSGLIIKNIGSISLIIGLYGLTFSVVEYLHPVGLITGIWSSIMPVKFYPQLLRLIKISWQFIGVIYYLMMVVGACLYIKQKLDNSGLLRFCFSVMFYGSIMGILGGLLQPLLFMQYLKQSGQTYPWWVMLWTLYPVILLILSKFIVNEMDRALKTIPEGNFSEPIENVLKTETGNTERFMHLMVDILITFSLALPIFYAVQFFMGQRDLFRSSRFLFLTLILVHRFFYYLILEGVFLTTPTKYLTRSTVVNSVGALTPDFGRIVLRSLCRFIPFEPFSFLGRNGWHDSLSGTLVVKDPYVKPGKSYNGIWIFLLFILPLGHYVIGLVKHDRVQNNTQEFEKRIRQEKRDGAVKHLSSDCLIVYEHKTNSYSDGAIVFKIDSVGSDSVWGYSFKVERSISGQITELNKAYLNSSNEDKGSIARQDIESIFVHEQPAHLIDERKIFLIRDIHFLNQPVISIGNGSSTRTNREANTVTVSWTLGDNLVPATLESIQNLEGKAAWTNSLPAKFSWSEESQSGHLNLSAEFKKQRSDVKALMIFSDPENNKYEYFIESYDSQVRVYPKY